jgi:hypothetical protein
MNVARKFSQSRTREIIFVPVTPDLVTFQNALMKKFFFAALAAILLASAHAQTTGKTGVKDSHDRFANIEVQYTATTDLPEGTAFTNGKITLKKGYRTSYADSNRVLIVQKPDGSTSGAFKCRCEASSSGGSCSVSITDGAIRCVATGGCDCTLDVIIKPTKNIAVTQSTGNWKKLIIPSAGSQRQNTEDPDQGGEIQKTKTKPAASKN